MSQRSAPMRGKPQPPREAVEHDPRLRILGHPVAASLMAAVRDVRTPALQFAASVRELTRFLLWQALADTPTEAIRVPGHAGVPVAARRMIGRIAPVAILRAGLGMLDPVRDLLPDAPIYQIGIKRNEETLEPAVYYTNLPGSFAQISHILLLDPMLATGGSASEAVRLLRVGYGGPISFLGLIGAPIGVRRLLDTDPQVRIYLVALDDRLDEHGYIMPGLGDAGDRLFGTL